MSQSCITQNLLKGLLWPAFFLAQVASVQADITFPQLPEDYRTAGGCTFPVRLTASTPEVGAILGQDRDSIDFDGTTLIVGASAEDAGGLANSGAAYVFRCHQSAWTLEARLTSPYPDIGDGFGYAVTVDGDELIVGAVYEDSGPGLPSNNQMSNAGAAYTYTRDSSGTWTFQQVLKASIPNPSDRFAHHLEMEGNMAIVCAKKEDSQAADGGGFYVYQKLNGSWTQTQWIPGTYDWGDFAASVAISGNTMVIGGLYYTASSGQNSGVVFVYRYDGANWVQEQILQPSNPDSVDEFGFSLALDGSRLVVGAISEDGNGSDPLDNSMVSSGAAYVYEKIGNSPWAEKAYLKASNVSAGGRFGMSVGLDGDTLAVGASHEDTGQADSGAVYIFKLQGGNNVPTQNWVESQIIKSTTVTASGRLGMSMVMADGIVAAGAPGEAVSGVSTAGASYLIEAD